MKLINCMVYTFIDLKANIQNFEIKKCDIILCKLWCEKSKIE